MIGKDVLEWSARSSITALAMLTLAKKDEAVQRNTVTSRRLIPSVWRPTPAKCDLDGGSDLSPRKASLWGSI